MDNLRIAKELVKLAKSLVAERPPSKYVIISVLQGMYDGKWSDLTWYNPEDTDYKKELNADRKSYAENEGVPLRTIHRRILRDELRYYHL